MATEGALGRRRYMALERIERKSEALSGGRKVNLPRQSRYGNDVLLILQLEALADFMDTLPTPEAAGDEPDSVPVAKSQGTGKRARHN